MKFIKNAVVSPDTWNADWFFESKTLGFMAAVHVYETEKGSYAVLFNPFVACFLIDDVTEKPADVDEIMKALAATYKMGIDEPEGLENVFGGAYWELGQQGYLSDRETLEKYGFSEEQIEDVKFRMDDLGNYISEEEVDM